MNFITNNQKGSIYAILSGLCYGLVGFFGTKILEEGFSITNMLFWRFLVATIIIFIMLIVTRTSFRVNNNLFIKVLFWGGIFYSTSAGTYFASTQYMGTGLPMVIFFTYPAMVMAIDWYFNKKKILKIYYFALILIMLGIILIVDIDKSELSLNGIFYALLSALSYAIYITKSKEQVSKLSPLLSTFIVTLGNCIVLFIFLGSTQTLIIPKNINYVIAIGVICTALPILFLLGSLKYIQPVKASILSVFEPICVVLVGVFALDEVFSNKEIIAIIILLSSAILVQLDPKWLKSKGLRNNS